MLAGIPRPPAVKQRYVHDRRRSLQCETVVPGRDTRDRRDFCPQTCTPGLIGAVAEDPKLVLACYISD